MSTDDKREVVMEDNKVTETVEDVKVEGTGNENTQTEKVEGAEFDVKAEAQKIADAMLAKKMKGMPTKEELKAFKDWQESQKTAEQKQAEKDAEHQKTLNELNALKQTNAVLSAGVKSDDADYVIFKVGKMEGEFEENLAKFLKDNPKYLGQELEEHKATGAPVRTLSSSQNDGVLGILAQKHPEIKF